MTTINESITEFAHLYNFWLLDEYAEKFLKDMLNKDLSKLTDNQKAYFLKIMTALIAEFKKRSTEDKSGKILNDLKEFFICYRDQIKPFLI